MDFFTLNLPEKIPLKPYMDFSVIYYIKWSVVAFFSVKPMNSVNLMSVKVVLHCTELEYSKCIEMAPKIYELCKVFILITCLLSSLPLKPNAEDRNQNM